MAFSPSHSDARLDATDRLYAFPFRGFRRTNGDPRFWHSPRHELLPANCSISASREKMFFLAFFPSVSFRHCQSTGTFLSVCTSHPALILFVRDSAPRAFRIADPPPVHPEGGRRPVILKDALLRESIFEDQDFPLPHSFLPLSSPISPPLLCFSDREEPPFFPS